MKKRKRSNNRSRVSKIALEWRREWKGGGNGNFSWESFKHSIFLSCWVNFWLLGRIFAHPQSYPWRFRGRRNQSIPGGCNNFVTFLVRREMLGIWFWEIVLLSDLALIELFQISHNCVTACTFQAKFLLKRIKTVKSYYVIFLSNRRGKFKLSDLQGDLPTTQFPRSVWYPDLTMRKALRVVYLLIL